MYRSKAVGPYFKMVFHIAALILLSLSTLQAAETPIDDVATAYTPNISIPNISEFTGTVNYQIPIPVPPGRQGVEPVLALQYSDGKKGIVGTAWSLELGAIQRQVKFSLDYFEDDYVHITPTSTTELVNKTADEYCAKVLTDFTRLFDNGSAGWEAVTREGIRYLYGQTNDSRITDSIVGTFRWALDRIEDPNGNYLTISYTKDEGQLYPHEIKYTGHTNPNLNPGNNVVFEYESRPDEFADYRPQFPVKTLERLSKIYTYGNGTAGAVYSLTYEQNPLTNSSRLASFQKLSADETESLPAQTFVWKSGGNGDFTSSPVYQSSFNNTNQQQYSHLEDVTGDGLTDLLRFKPNADTYNNITVYISPANGNGGFGTQYTTLLDLDGDTDDDSVDFKLVHIDRDGLIDIYAQKREDTSYGTQISHYYFYGKSDGTFESTPVSLPISTYYEPLADLNGDGLADMIFPNNLSGNTLYLYVMLSNGDGTFGDRQCTTYNNTAGNTSFSDINGDGMADMILSGSSSSTAYLSKGDGTFIDDATQGISINDGFTHRTADVNGDGHIDKTGFNFILADANSIPFNSIATYTQLSEGDQDFGPSYRVVLSCSGEKDRPFSVNFAELNGDGIKDIVVLAQSESNSRTTNYVYSFLGLADETPDRLHRIENGYGATTTITETFVKPSEKSFAPFPLYRIESIVVDSGVGPVNTTTYTDFDGCLWDAAKRDFRGFESVRTTYADYTARYTEFEQGAYLKSRASLIDTTSTLTSQLLTRVSNTWIADEDPTDSFAHVYLDLKETRIYDNPDYPGQQTGLVTEDYAYDDLNGYVTSIETSGDGGAETLTQTMTHQEYGNDIWRKATEQLEGSTSGVVRQKAYRYDSLGNLEEEERYCLGGSSQDCAGSYIRSYAYDTYGNRVNEWDEKHTTTDPPTATITYDTATHSFPVSVANALGHATTQGWNYDYGKLAWRQDVNGRRTDLEYDDVGRLEAVDYPDGGRKSFTYDFSASPYRVTTDVLETAGQNITTWSDYDGLGRPVQSVARGDGGNYMVTKAHRDPVGRVTLATGPFFRTGNTYLDWAADGYPGTLDYAWTATDYDARGRALTITTPDEDQADATTTYLYNGYATTITDADGTARTLTRDHLDRILVITEHTDTGDQITHYDYNAAGEMTEVRNALYGAAANPDKFKIVMDYNSLGRKISLEDPDMGIWTYSYDANGNLASQTDGKGLTTTFAYDDLDRLERKIFPAGSGDSDSVYEYCNTNSSANRALNLVGRLQRVSNDNAVTRYQEYDPMGRVSRVRKKVIDATGHARYGDLEYEYDLAGKVSRLIYPEDDLDNQDDESNYTVTYDYHQGTGLIDTVSDSDGRDLATLTDYSEAGKIGTLTFDNGATSEYTYNPHSLRLTNITATPSQGAAIINKAYKYSPAGDIITIDDMVANDTYTYTYDSLHRLTEEDSADAVPPEPMVIEFTYADNDGTQPLNAPETVRINGEDYILGYDENGNMTDGYNFTSPASVLQRDIDFNSANMPLMVSNGSAQVDFSYDADGGRVLKATSASSTLYFGTNFEVIDGTPTRYVFAGNLRIAKVTPTGIEYFHKDHLGSSTVMTKEDGLKDSGTAYLPFGMQRGTETITSTGYAFTDQERDDSTGLYNYDARLYDPVIGRFLSADSIIPDLYNPQSLNRYSYCYNNPLKYVDPTGHLPGAEDYEKHGMDFWGGTPYESDGKGNESDSNGTIANNYLIQPTLYWVNAINNVVVFPALEILSLPDQVLDYFTGTTFEERMAYAAQFPGGFDDFALGAVGAFGRLPRLIGAPKKTPNVNWGQQEKHFPGHNSYTPGRSTMTSNPEKLAEKAGTGLQVGNKPVGTPGSKERVNFGESIGTYIDETGNALTTNKGIIHYGKKGIHVVPARP